jgi:uncharacterized repeat protein (TIGR01451 family)
MKKSYPIILLFVLLMFHAHSAFAQAGGVYTAAGGGSSTVEGVPATNALFDYTTGIATDAAGNLYVADRGRSVIRMIDAGSGLIYTVAGISGYSGFAGDGGLASAALLSSNIRGIHVTATGDIYISDNTRVRRVNSATGIITTVAGGGTSPADGIPATIAVLSLNHVFVDSAGNIYVGSGDRIKKVDAATGLITTIAGGGTSTADGVPATNASIIGSAKSICMDNAGNLYVVGGAMTEKIRKIDAATGLITTVAGGGSSDDDGIPATNMDIITLHSCRVDGAGNIFIADKALTRIRRVDAVTGLVNTIAGAPFSGSSAEGAPALSANVDPYMIWLHTATSTVYYSDFGERAKKFTYAPMVPLTGSGGGSPGAYSSDSFYVNIFRQCSGPRLTVRTHSYLPGTTIRTYYGDGTGDTLVVGASWSGIGGYVLAGRAYSVSGTYTIKHVLCYSGVPVDSFSYSYNHVYCSQMAVKFYNDADLNCVKDGTDKFLARSIVTEIDSNGVPVDTMVTTSGFSYLAYGNPGDIYTFRIISAPPGLYPSCPATGILRDTLVAGLNANPVRYAALDCISPAASDLQVSAHVPVTGPNDQWGRIYVRNNGCLNSDASVTLNFSPKYRYTTGAKPPPVSSTATSLTWSLSALNSTDVAPLSLYFVVWHNPAVPYPTDGDTVNEHISVATTGGPIDVNMTNNVIIRTDTVRTSCDPNAIEVSPRCFDNDTTFHFTVHFENIGSAPAENIYVMDTLSSWLDPSTFNIELSTHTMFISKHIANGRTILKFDFPDINLADSSDHENRDGAFMYTIRNKPGMAIGVAAYSRVGIYFDYNDVLMTNTVANTKGCPIPADIATSAKYNEIAIFPNPTTSELTIKVMPGIFNALTITNTIGQQVLQQSMLQSQLRLNVDHLPKGVYYVTLKGEQGSEIRKFVKW